MVHYMSQRQPLCQQQQQLLLLSRTQEQQQHVLRKL
jgi:hypothetical protein